MKNPNKRIIIYYQTLISLQPIINILNTKTTWFSLFSNQNLLSDITLASIHFGFNDDNTPYIHLNNDVPTSDKFISVYNELKTIKKYDVQINLLIGGAGSAFTDLFNNYNIFYPLLKSTITNTLEFIDGFNLDVEEEVTFDNIVKLVNNLKSDFPNKQIIFAPLSNSLATDEPGMGGFSYKELDNKIGHLISYYNVQCYGDYSLDLFNKMVNNGYLPEKIVMGMLTGQNFDLITSELEKISKINNFGGVAIWEYFNAPPGGTSKPFEWLEEMEKILY